MAESPSHPSVGTPPSWTLRPDCPALDHYLLGPERGRGGMGRVLEAWDTLLRRRVALKLLHSTDPELLVRFFREAQIQARLDHPNICGILELGADPERPYLVMPLIEGRTLGSLRDELDHRAMARIMAEVAGAIQWAHRSGLVHRDLKPQNILVETLSGGATRPVVVDFGLARDLAGEDSTLAWSRAGTPAYMSPEQARGAPPTPQADVYSLGATLFDLLHGSPPGQAITQADPPRMPALRDRLAPDPCPPPKGLETIAAKCLEADPAQRYQSALELEMDLRRYLAGEPIRARPITRLTLAWRWARHNPALPAALASSLLAAFALLGWNLRTRSHARRQVDLVQRFGVEVRDLERRLQIERMLPPHDVRPGRRAALKQIARLQDQLPGLEPGTRGPLFQAIGMGHLALLDWEQARSFLQRAWDEGERDPATAMGLGTALSELYQQGLDESRQSLGPQGLEPRRQALRATFLQPALALLLPLRATQTEGRAYLEAILDLHGGNHQAAIGKAKHCRERNPADFEPVVLEARAWIAQAEQEADHGQPRQAIASLQSGGQGLALALDALRSDPELWLLEARRCLALGAILEDSAPMSEVLAAYQGAREACVKAMRLDPDHLAAHLQAARTCFLRGRYARDHGVDIAPTAAEALRWAREATILAPGTGAGYHWLGQINLMVAKGQDQNNRSDATTLDEAMKALHASESLGWPSAYPLAYACRLRAKAERRSGGDPIPFLLDGVAWCRKAVATETAKEPPYQLALILLNLAEAKAALGQDPTQELNEAAALSEKGYLGFHDGIFLYTLAHAHLQRALHLRADGKRYQEPLEAALRTAKQAVAQGPRHAILHLTLGLVEALQVQSQMDRTAPCDPGPARKAFQAALTLNPLQVETFAGLAKLELLVARYTGATESLERARAALATAARLGPEAPEIAALQAQYYRQRFQAGARRTPADLDLGLAQAERGLALNPHQAQALAELGVLMILKGTYEQAPALQAKGLARLSRALTWDLTLNREYRSWKPKGALS